jgi:hypothetical protein
MMVVRATESHVAAIANPVAPWMREFALAALSGQSKVRVSDFSRTLLLPDGMPLCVWGIVPQRPAVAEVWAVVDQHAIAHKREVMQYASLHLQVVERGLGLRRIYGPIRVGFEVGVHFAEALGFKREGLMRNFGPDGKGDYYLYARTTP